MKFGLAYDLLSSNAEAPLATEDIVRDARLAEKLGFNSIWAGESHQAILGHGHLPSPLLGLAAIAPSTEKIRLGTGVLLLPLYEPLRLAEDAAVLDCLSRGRLTLGLALGGELNRKAYNVIREQTAGIFEESVTILKRLWTEKQISFSGKYFTYDRVSVTPKPLQKGGPPILIGGGTLASTSRAAKMATGWIGASNHGTTLLLKLIRHYRNSLATKSVGLVVVNRVVYIEKDDSTAADEGTSYFRDFASYYLSRGALKTSKPVSTLDDEEVVRSLMTELAIIGSPDSCIKTIEKYEGMGVDQLNLRVRLPGMKSGQTEKTMKLISEKVFPHFNELT